MHSLWGPLLYTPLVQHYAVVKVLTTYSECVHDPARSAIICTISGFVVRVVEYVFR